MYTRLAIFCNSFPGRCTNSQVPRPAQLPRVRQRSRLGAGVSPEEEAFEGPVLEPLDLSSTGGLGGTSETVFGPLAVVLVGFSESEFRRFREMLLEMEADFVKLVPCTEASLTSTLEAVLSLEEEVAYAPGPLGLRRTVFLSGMYASEVQEVVSAYDASGLPDAVFAAFVPKNREKRICDLVEEVYEDDLYMRERKQ